MKTPKPTAKEMAAIIAEEVAIRIDAIKPNEIKKASIYVHQELLEEVIRELEWRV